MAETPPLFFEKRLGALFPACPAAEKICQHCGSTFTRGKRSHKDFQKQRFCSKACVSAGKGGGPDARFDTYYVKTPQGCWLWQRSTYGPGYGTFCINGRREPAHRYAYERANGPVPAGMIVMHACDIPGCVNPAHLEAGTQLRNIRDAKARGRTARGIRHGAAKLSEDQVRFIRSSDEPGVALARRFGVGAAIISGIRNGTHWRHL